MAGNAAAIVGIHEYPSRKVDGLSPLQIKAASAVAALADAGLTVDDVDAIYDAGETGPMSGIVVPEYLGITPRVVDTTAVGGSSYQFHAAHAMRDIAAGRARVALLTYGSTARSEARAIGTGARRVDVPTPGNNMEIPFGVPLIGNYALVARRHMHQYGTTPEQLAEVAVTTRAHAVRNPEAVAALGDLGIRHTGEITVDDVLSGRMIADPLHLLECCLVSDGGGAVVIAGADVAKDVATDPVWLLGGGEAVGYPGNDRDITESAAARSGPPAFSEAGVEPGDVDIAMIYDSFTITVLTLLEDLGFAKKGEGGTFVEDGRMRWDRPGAPALNTDGGGLSSNHPGMRGIFLLIEAARQLRGTSTSQVPDARTAVAHGNGGLLGTRHAAATVLLGRN